MTIDFTPTPPITSIPEPLQRALRTMNQFECEQVYIWLDGTPKADVCLLQLLEQYMEMVKDAIVVGNSSIVL